MTRFASFALVFLVACGGAGKKNVDACNNYIDSLSCGAYDFSTLYGDGYCDAYAETTCDISDYFNCLADGSTCEGDVYTPATDCTIPACG